MNLNQFRYFILSAEEGSYASASKKAYASPTGLSKAVSDLEKDLGVQLFSRSREGLHLTPVGELIYDRVKEIVDRIDLLQASLPHIDDHGAKQVYRLAVPYEFMRVREIRYAINTVSSKAGHCEIAILPSSNSGSLFLLRFGLVHASIVAGGFDRDLFSCVDLLSLEFGIRTCRPLSDAEVSSFVSENRLSASSLQPMLLDYDGCDLLFNMESESLRSINNGSEVRESVCLAPRAMITVGRSNFHYIDEKIAFIPFSDITERVLLRFVFPRKGDKRQTYDIGVALRDILKS